MLRDPVLVLVDLQKDFCQPPFSTASVEASFSEALDAIAAFLDAYRASGRTPVFVRTAHDERSNSPTWAEKYAGRDRPMPCRPGTEGAEFVDAVTVEDSDVVVTKHRYSAFYRTQLETYLVSNGVTRLLVGGVNTNVCVASTITDAFDRDYDVTVLEDCTTTIEPALHEPALENIASNFGSVRQSRDVDL